MAFILWRPGIGGADQYLTEWVKEIDTAVHSNSLKDALRYQTRAAADAAIAHRTPAGWQVREIADPS
jgi:hypothetical protein